MSCPTSKNGMHPPTCNSIHVDLFAGWLNSLRAFEDQSRLQYMPSIYIYIYELCCECPLLRKRDHFKSNHWHLPHRGTHLTSFFQGALSCSHGSQALCPEAPTPTPVAPLRRWRSGARMPKGVVPYKRLRSLDPGEGARVSPGLPRGAEPGSLRGVPYP